MKIYHYTTIETLALIIKSRAIRFNRLDCVDDLEESLYGSGNMNIKLSQYEFVSCWTKDKEENLALWKMYTNNKGVRICMDDDFLISYDVTPKFKSFLSSAIQMGDDYFVSSFMNEAKLFDVIYTNEYIDKINSLISQKGEMISIDTRHLGLYKSERWKFQNESRFKIIVMPKNNKYVNVPNQASDFDILFNMMSSLAPSMASQSPIKIKHIDVGIKEEKLNEIEVMMGPETTEAERYIVEMLLSKFENSSIKDSYFKGKIKSK